MQGVKQYLLGALLTIMLVACNDIQFNEEPEDEMQKQREGISVGNVSD
jgi:hypothetical protein